MRLRNKKGRSDRGRKTLTRGKQRKLDEKKNESRHIATIKSKTSRTRKKYGRERKLKRLNWSGKMA